MSLRNIKPKHREIMRRMLMYQPMEEISKELQVSAVYLNMLTRDPLFVETMGVMEAEIHQKWKERRVAAMDILEDNASKAAKLCVDAVDGLVQVPGEENQYDIVPLKERLNSAWDVLNRTGNKAVERKVVAHTTLQEMIIMAYKQRTEGENRGKASTPSSGSAQDIKPERVSDVFSNQRQLDAPKADEIVDVDDEDDDGYDPFCVASMGNA